MMWGPKKGTCGATTLVHAIDAARRRDVVTCYLEKLCAVQPAISNLSEMMGVSEQMMDQVPARIYACLQLQDFKRDQRQAFENFFYNWPSEQRRCFLLQFIVPGKADHIVCVDGRHRLVWDNEEEYPTELNAKSLRFCSGAGSRNVRVRAMETVQQHQKRDLERKPVEVI